VIALVEAAVTAASLTTRYAQPHRRYHTLVHVKDVLRRIDELAPAPEEVTALQLAAWFHDAVYAPGRDDNEGRSAFLATETLEVVGGSPTLGAEVGRLVLLTASHDPRPDDRAGSVLSDADLSILGSESGAYATYTEAIREEYSLVRDDVFRAGRTRILKHLLLRPTLFHTSIGQHNWEDKARTNIEREIRKLEG
jgi:predicted metal-dependent HD superfamily phosphohydrolase